MNIYNKLREVKDLRSKKGKLYPLYPILSLVLLSRLCGYTSLKGAFHLLARLHPKQKIQLGFKRHCELSYSRLTEIVGLADIESLETTLSSIVNSLNGNDDDDELLTALSIDGKTLGGRKGNNGKAYHLVSLFCNKVRGVYGQIKSNTGGGEIAAALSLIKKVDLSGKIISGDALFSNGNLCQEIVNRGGDYIFTVKSNQQELRHRLLQVFRTNPWKSVERTYEEEMTLEHGRIEKRKIRVMNWPYMKKRGDGFDTIEQVAEITRYRDNLSKPEEDPIESKAYIITSCRESKASAKQLLEFNRGHWGIENRLHYTKDTLFLEDQSNLRTGYAPQSNSALSNLAITLLEMIRNKKKKYKNMSFTNITKDLNGSLKIPIQFLQTL